eukprot:XP_764730.1 hypothetical protein [Theileria parva strain Muguga]
MKKAGMIVEFCLIQFWVCKALYLDLGQAEETGAGKISHTQISNHNLPPEGYENDDFGTGNVTSFAEKAAGKSNSTKTKKPKHIKKSTNKPNNQKEKVKETKKTTVEEDNDNSKRTNSRDLSVCKKGPKCKKHSNNPSNNFSNDLSDDLSNDLPTGKRGKRGRKERLAAIKSHNLYSEDFESESRVSKKKLSPKIKNFALSSASKIAQHGLPIATKLANNLINNKLPDDEEDADDADLGDILGEDDDNNDKGDEDDKSEDLTGENNSNDVEEDEEDETGESEGEYEAGEGEEEENETDDLHEEETNNDEESDDLEDTDDTQDEVEDTEEESEELEDVDYVKRFKTPSGLEYLGAGYDLIRGNPLGDSVTLLDPGYKSSVIQMHWSRNIENISNSLRFLQPVGGWIRPYSSCHKVTEINSCKSLLKSLSADASVSLSLPGDVFKFSASAKFKKLQDVSKSGKSKMFINKSYCFKYVAGISTSLKWDFTLGFQSSLGRLSDFKGLEKDSICKPFIYREDPKNENCQELGISDWMELFNTFGTHVATKIYLGGKIFTTLEIKKSQEKKLSDQGLDVRAILSAKIKDTDIDSNVEVSTIKSKNAGDFLLDTKKSTFVLGGDIYGHGKTIEFAEWARSVADHAMPIKAEFTPISHFIDKNLRDAYNKAYLYYGKVILESDFLRYQSQVELTPEDLISEVEIEHAQGTGDVKASCKDGKLVQFGFMILSLKDGNHEVKECPIHATECSAPAHENVGHSTLWIACRAQNIVNLRQTITKEPACDNGFHIFLGTYFFENKSKYLLMKPCKLGSLQYSYYYN